MGAHSTDSGDVQWPQQDPDLPGAEQIQGAIEQARVHRVELSHESSFEKLVDLPLHQQTGGGGAGGSFSMSPDEVHAKVTELKSIKDEIEDLKRDLQDAQRPIHKPALDSSSTAQASGSLNAVGAAITHVGNCHAYADDFIDKLGRSVGDVTSTEQANKGEIRKHDPKNSGDTGGGFI